MNIVDYIQSKVNELKSYGVAIPEKKLNEFYESLISKNLSDEEMTRTVDEVYRDVLKKQLLNIKAENGQYSNFEQVQRAVDFLVNSPIGKYITIFGGTVPYLIKNQAPKRLIGDIDLHVDIEHINEVREFIKSNSDKIQILFDTDGHAKDDYGLEIKMDGLEISVFPMIDTPEGRITNSFVYRDSVDELFVKSTLFYGIHNSDDTISVPYNGKSVKMTCPEYIYILKSVALREKDMIDIEVLKGLIDVRKVQYLKEKSQTPQVIFEEKIKLDDGVKKEI